jgi:hypothetical protein
MPDVRSARLLWAWPRRLWGRGHSRPGPLARSAIDGADHSLYQTNILAERVPPPRGMSELLQTSITRMRSGGRPIQLSIPLTKIKDGRYAIILIRPSEGDCRQLSSAPSKYVHSPIAQGDNNGQSEIVGNSEIIGHGHSINPKPDLRTGVSTNAITLLCSQHSL